MRERRQRPTLRAKLDGDVYALPVCWNAERVRAVETAYPGGVVDLDGPQAKNSPATPEERDFLRRLLRSRHGRAQLVTKRAPRPPARKK